MNTAPSKLPHQPALDGIRAAAVSIVLFFHAGFEWASGAFLGISTFFTLSGFLITGILVAEYEATGKIAVVSFWGRRIRRLMPAALLTLLAMSAYAAFVADPAELLQVRGDVLSALFYVSNWRFWITGQSYLRILSDPSPVQHLWSLSIEEQFYLFFPLIVLATLRASGGSRRILAGVLVGIATASALLTIWLYGDGDGYSRVYYGTDTRAPELLVGALLALWCNGRRLSDRTVVIAAANVVGLVCIVFTGWLWVVTAEGAGWFFRGGAVPYSIATAAIIFAALHPGPVRSLLSLAPFRWVGLISYGLYVYHWPIFLWLDADYTGLEGWALFAVRAGVTYVVATISYLVIEAPVRARRFVWSAHERKLALVTASVVIVSISLVTMSLYRPGLGAEEELAETIPEDSLPTGRGARVLVVGDSVARNIGRGLVQWNRRKLQLQVFNRALVACGVARARTRRLADGSVVEVGTDCTDTWPGLVADLHPDVVVVMTGVWDLLERTSDTTGQQIGPGDDEFDDWLLAEFETAVDVLGAGGATIAWMTFPCAKQQHYPGLIDIDRALADENVRHLNEVLLPRLVARRPGIVHLVPFHEKVCPGGVFRHALGPVENARADGLHFHLREADWIAGWLAPQIVKLPRRPENPVAPAGSGDVDG